MKKRLTIFPAIFLAILFIAQGYSCADIAQMPVEWIEAKGYFCTIYYKPDVDIELLNEKIDTYRVDFGLTETPVYNRYNVQDELLYKFDLVFLKAQEILDMRPRDINLRVNMYRVKNDLKNIYMDIFDEEGNFIAFYVFKLNTLFACEEKISASVLAHEMAHCIIDHHFKTVPPEKVGELLAHYVELHLRK